jgi:DNA-directed RNA polymerase specialized sigma24 family protein
VLVDDVETWGRRHDAGSDPGDREDVERAFRGLPVRWQRVLWQLEVEGRRPRELAVELGMTPNAVSALGKRARAGLRKAYAGEADVLGTAV